VLRDSGGLSNNFGEIAGLFRKQTGALIIEDIDPERLVDRCAQCYSTDDRPSSFAFEGIAHD
ncbi:MAG: hypothetical protein ABSF08_09580, partial [Candidatus Cybelea sp.]